MRMKYYVVFDGTLYVALDQYNFEGEYTAEDVVYSTKDMDEAFGYAEAMNKKAGL